MGKYYFDLKQTVVKTVAVEADSLEQAENKVATALANGELCITDGRWDDAELNNVNEEVETLIKKGFCDPDEFETFN